MSSWSIFIVEVFEVVLRDPHVAARLFHEARRAVARPGAILIPCHHVILSLFGSRAHAKPEYRQQAMAYQDFA